MALQRSDETRTRILDAAARRFSADGFKSATVDDVCADARVSKGAFYYHFASKQAVFLALLDRWLKTLDVSIDGMRKATIPQTLLQMTQMLPAIFESAHDSLVMWLEFWLQASRDKQVWEATIAPYHHYRDLFAGMVEEGIAEGTIKNVDPQATAQAILSMAVGMFLQGTLDPQGADWQRVAEQSMQILMNGLTTSEQPRLSTETST